MSSTASCLDETNEASFLSQASLSLSQQNVFANTRISNKVSKGKSPKLYVELNSETALMPSNEIPFSDRSTSSSWDSVNGPLSMEQNGIDKEAILHLSHVTLPSRI
uniref:Uncharacterized protein n=1 Tax=Arundo donax TaxID=35708 RepID=A0A0A9D832_ARUDO